MCKTYSTEQHLPWSSGVKLSLKNCTGRDFDTATNVFIASILTNVLFCPEYMCLYCVLKTRAVVWQAVGNAAEALVGHGQPIRA